MVLLGAWSVISVHVFDSLGWENAMRGDDERSEGFFSLQAENAVDAGRFHESRHPGGAVLLGVQILRCCSGLIHCARSYSPK